MRPDRSMMRQFARYSALAMTLPVATFVGYAIGYGLDKLFNTHFLYLVFLLLGTFSGLANLIRDLSKEKP